ncbi:hypothetical protein [Streptomyces triticirhizae]|uniref:hypothetical protein n=1 Tax=Streptomyces triticirhizae TaxID=2483353 RepID=UPI00131504B6|nr:hypothetical protein [Streptomyces triticirhizae]
MTRKRVRNRPALLVAAATVLTGGALATGGVPSSACSTSAAPASSWTATSAR